MHSGDMQPDNGYDKNGKKINNNGGDTTDYRYDDNGNVISSTSVKISTYQGGEVSSNTEGYGYRIRNIGTGGALYDPSFDIMKDYVLGKTAVKGLGIVWNVGKVPLAKGLGTVIKSYAPSLNKGRYFRIGISQAKVDGKLMTVFRATYGNNKKHFFNIILGKHGTIKY